MMFYIIDICKYVVEHHRTGSLFSPNSRWKVNWFHHPNWDKGRRRALTNKNGRLLGFNQQKW